MLPALTLAAALTLESVAGALWQRPWALHPVRLMGKGAEKLERCLNRPSCSPGRRRAFGVVVTACVTLSAALCGLGLSLFLRLWPYGWLAEAVIVALFLCRLELAGRVAAVADALGRRRLTLARRRLVHICGRDTASLNEASVARAAIEGCFENFSDAVVSPVVWYAVGGLPALLFAKAADTLDSMFGHRDARYLSFGWAAARLDDIVQFAPSRLSVLFIAAAAFFNNKKSGRAALAASLRDGRRHASFNAGWPEAAAGGALGVALAGPRRYGARLVPDPFIGGGGVATVTDVRRSLVLYGRACRLNAVAGVGLAGGVALAL